MFNQGCDSTMLCLTSILQNDLYEDLISRCVFIKAPAYIKEYTHLYFTGSRSLQSKVSGKFSSGSFFLINILFFTEAI